MLNFQYSAWLSLSPKSKLTKLVWSSKVLTSGTWAKMGILCLIFRHSILKGSTSDRGRTIKSHPHLSSWLMQTKSADHVRKVTRPLTKFVCIYIYIYICVCVCVCVCVFVCVCVVSVIILSLSVYVCIIIAAGFRFVYLAFRFSLAENLSAQCMG